MDRAARSRQGRRRRGRGMRQHARCLTTRASRCCLPKPPPRTCRPRFSIVFIALVLIRSLTHLQAQRTAAEAAGERTALAALSGSARQQRQRLVCGLPLLLPPPLLLSFPVVCHGMLPLGVSACCGRRHAHMLLPRRMLPTPAAAAARCGCSSLAPHRLACTCSHHLPHAAPAARPGPANAPQHPAPAAAAHRCPSGQYTFLYCRLACCSFLLRLCEKVTT